MIGHTSRGERVVAHDIAYVSVAVSVIARCQPFLELDTLVRFFVTWLGPIPIDEVQVEPCLVVATLISFFVSRVLGVG